MSVSTLGPGKAFIAYLLPARIGPWVRGHNNSSVICSRCKLTVSVDLELEPTSWVDRDAIGHAGPDLFVSAVVRCTCRAVHEVITIPQRHPDTVTRWPQVDQAFLQAIPKSVAKYVAASGGKMGDAP